MRALWNGLRLTELYHRACFTLFLYKALINILICISILGQTDKAILLTRYIIQIVVEVYLVLPIVKRYLDFEVLDEKQ
jgi:hypothetical protein